MKTVASIFFLISLIAFSGCAKKDEPESNKKDRGEKMAAVNCNALFKKNQVPDPAKGAGCINTKPGLIFASEYKSIKEGFKKEKVIKLLGPELQGRVVKPKGFWDSCLMYKDEEKRNISYQICFKKEKVAFKAKITAS